MFRLFTPALFVKLVASLQKQSKGNSCWPSSRKLGQSHSTDAISGTGVTAIKFGCIADAEIVSDKFKSPLRVDVSRQITGEEWSLVRINGTVKTHCESVGCEFIYTIFQKAVQVLDELGMSQFKRIRRHHKSSLATQSPRCKCRSIFEWDVYLRGIDSERAIQRKSIKTTVLQRTSEYPVARAIN